MTALAATVTTVVGVVVMSETLHTQHYVANNCSNDFTHLISINLHDSSPQEILVPEIGTLKLKEIQSLGQDHTVVNYRAQDAARADAPSTPPERGCPLAPLIHDWGAAEVGDWGAGSDQGEEDELPSFKCDQNS